jgi:hypothetical protein
VLSRYSTRPSGFMTHVQDSFPRSLV